MIFANPTACYVCARQATRRTNKVPLCDDCDRPPRELTRVQPPRPTAPGFISTGSYPHVCTGKPVYVGASIKTCNNLDCLVHHCEALGVCRC